MKFGGKSQELSKHKNLIVGTHMNIKAILYIIGLPSSSKYFIGLFRR